MFLLGLLLHLWQLDALLGSLDCWLLLLLLLLGLRLRLGSSSSSQPCMAIWH